jgi:hypothetical protein
MKIGKMATQVSQLKKVQLVVRKYTDSDTIAAEIHYRAGHP